MHGPPNVKMKNIIGDCRSLGRNSNLAINNYQITKHWSQTTRYWMQYYPDVNSSFHVVWSHSEQLYMSSQIPQNLGVAQNFYLANIFVCVLHSTTCRELQNAVQYWYMLVFNQISETKIVTNVWQQLTAEMENLSVGNIIPTYNKVNKGLPFTLST